MRTLILILFFITAGLLDGCFGDMKSYAANTSTLNTFTYGVEADMTFDSTGVQCVEVHGFPNLFVVVDLTSGTATYDIETSTTGISPNETGNTSDLTSNATADDTYEGEVGARYLCVRLDACSSCAVSVYLSAIGNRGN